MTIKTILVQTVAANICTTNGSPVACRDPNVLVDPTAQKVEFGQQRQSTRESKRRNDWCCARAPKPRRSSSRGDAHRLICSSSRRWHASSPSTTLIFHETGAAEPIEQHFHTTGIYSIEKSLQRMPQVMESGLHTALVSSTNRFVGLHSTPHVEITLQKQTVKNSMSRSVGYYASTCLQKSKRAH